MRPARTHLATAATLSAHSKAEQSHGGGGEDAAVLQELARLNEACVRCAGGGSVRLRR